MKIAHITNFESAAGTLRFVFNEERMNEDNIVLCLNDMLYFGPLYQVGTEEGMKKRKDYIDNIGGELYEKNPHLYPEKNYIELEAFKNYDFSKYDKVVVWHANNAAEQLLKALCCHTIDFDKLYEIDATNLCNQETGFVPRAVAECDPTIIKHLLSTANKVALDDYKSYANIWNEAISSSSLIRICTNGKIQYVSDDYFDTTIISKCTKEYVRALRIVGEVMGTTEHLLGDALLVSRVFHLIDMNKIQYRGDLNNIRSVELKVQ